MKLIQERKKLNIKNKSELRTEDNYEILNVLSTLSNKKIMCRVESCNNEAHVIEQKNPLCSDCWMKYKSGN